jgi:hypothetical protein
MHKQAQHVQNTAIFKAQVKGPGWPEFQTHLHHQTPVIHWATAARFTARRGARIFSLNLLTVGTGVFISVRRGGMRRPHSISPTRWNTEFLGAMSTGHPYLPELRSSTTGVKIVNAWITNVGETPPGGFPNAHSRDCSRPLGQTSVVSTKDLRASLERPPEYFSPSLFPLL